jgi:hypothetical protein
MSRGSWAAASLTVSSVPQASAGDMESWQRDGRAAQTRAQAGSGDEPSAPDVDRLRRPTRSACAPASRPRVREPASARRAAGRRGESVPDDRPGVARTAAGIQGQPATTGNESRGTRRPNARCTPRESLRFPCCSPTGGVPSTPRTPDRRRCTTRSELPPKRWTATGVARNSLEWRAVAHPAPTVLNAPGTTGATSPRRARRYCGFSEGSPTPSPVNLIARRCTGYPMVIGVRGRHDRRVNPEDLLIDLEPGPSTPPIEGRRGRVLIV